MTQLRPKLFLLLFIFVAAIARGETCRTHLLAYADQHLSADLPFAFQSPLPRRDPAAAKELGLNERETKGLLDAYDTAAKVISEYDDANAMLEGMGAYYQQHYDVGEDRLNQLNVIAEQATRLVEDCIARAELRNDTLFYLLTGHGEEGAKAGFENCDRPEALRQIMPLVQVARTQMLIIQKERLRLLSTLESMMNEFKAPKDFAPRIQTQNEAYETAFSILMWEGLSPVRITVTHGETDYLALTWHDDGRTSLGALITEMRDFEPERRYQVVYSPGFTASGGGNASITSERSPFKREILAVSARAIYEVAVDSSVRHEIRHAEIFRLLKTRTDTDLNFFFQSITRPIPFDPEADRAYSHADELYTMAENVMSHSKDALDAWRRGDQEAAKLALRMTSFFAHTGQTTAELVLRLSEESQESLHQVNRDFDLERGSTLVEQLIITDTHKVSQTTYQVGPNDDHKLGFIVRENIVGKPYVVAHVTHQGILGEYPMMGLNLIEPAREYALKAVAANGHPELSKGFPLLIKALEAGLEKRRWTVRQYGLLYSLIHAKVYKISTEGITEAGLEELVSLCERFAPFTPTFTPQIE